MEDVAIKGEFIKVEVKIEPCDEQHYTELVENTIPSTSNYDLISKIEIKQEVIEENFKNDFQNVGIEEPNLHSDSGEKSESADKVSRKNDRVPCPKCDRTLKNRTNLKQHLRTVHLEVSENIKCPDCDRTFKSKEYLWNHQHSVHYTTEEVPCPVCNKIFTNKRRLDNHIYFTHKDTDEVQCMQCGKTFYGKRKLKVHMKYVHTFEGNIQCSECQQRFKSEMLLKKHMQYNHGDSKTYKCYCDKIFDSRIKYKKHVDQVHSSQPRQCLLCRKILKTIQIGKKHLRIIHKLNVEDLEGKLADVPSNIDTKFSNTIEERKDVRCDLCFKVFPCHSVYYRHLRSTHPPKEKETACDVCHRMFKSPHHLRVHKSSVHKQEILFCTQCNQSFTSRKYLARHMKRHNSLQERFICEICKKVYKCQEYLKKHIRKVHDNNIVVEVSLNSIF